MTICRAATIKPFNSDDSWENESHTNCSKGVKGVTSLSRTRCLDEYTQVWLKNAPHGRRQGSALRKFILRGEPLL